MAISGFFIGQQLLRLGGIFGFDHRVPVGLQLQARLHAEVFIIIHNQHLDRFFALRFFRHVLPLCIDC